jgi:antitoxin component of MazEF toxin-antitoxin module
MIDGNTGVPRANITRAGFHPERSRRILDAIGGRDTLEVQYTTCRRPTLVKRLTQHGNSAALIIDKAVLDLLHITMETPLEIVTDGKNLIISPIRTARRAQRFHAALDATEKR